MDKWNINSLKAFHPQHLFPFSMNNQSFKSVVEPTIQWQLIGKSIYMVGVRQNLVKSDAVRK